LTPFPSIYSHPIRTLHSTATKPFDSDMKSLLQILFLVAMLMPLVTADSQTLHQKESPFLSTIKSHNNTKNSVTPSSESEELASLRGAKSLHGRGAMTCDKYPRVCRAKGSEGPDCCKKKCVNVSRDRNNCGMCGKKCKYSQVCCKGKCVNPMSDKHHCGKCGNKCTKGDFCVFGLCSYAWMKHRGIYFEWRTIFN